MDSIISVLQSAWRYIMLVRITDVLDVAIMSFAIYKLLSLVRSTRAENIFKGIVIFIVALWLSSLLNLRGINYILSYVVEWGVLALFIVFQPELRRGLEQLGSKNIRLVRLLSPEQHSTELEKAIDQTVLACMEMSKTRTGVLIVFERSMMLNDMLRSGTTLDAAVSSELLKNIFFVKAPMHEKCESKPGSGHAPPGGHWYERKLRRGGGDRFRGDRLYFGGHRRDAQAASNARNPVQAAEKRADARPGAGDGYPKRLTMALAAYPPKEGRRRE